MTRGGKFVAILSGLGLLLCLGLFWCMVRQAQPVVWIGRIDISLPVGKEIIIGRRELGQRGADAADQHLAIRHATDGWSFRNVAVDRKVDFETDQLPTVFIRRWYLEAGDRMSIGTNVITFTEVGPDRITWSTQAGHTGTWKAGRAGVSASHASLDHRSGDECGTKTWLWIRRETRTWWDRTETVLATFGGRFVCGLRWPLLNVEPDAIALIRDKRGVALAPSGSNRDGAYAALQRTGGSWMRWQDMSLPYQGPLTGTVERVTLGRTAYRIWAEGDTLHLVPNRNRQVWNEDESGEIELRASQLPTDDQMPKEIHRQRLADVSIGAGAPLRAVLWERIASGELPLLGLVVAAIGWLLHHHFRWQAAPLACFGLTLILAFTAQGSSGGVPLDGFWLCATTLATWLVVTWAVWHRGWLNGYGGLLWLSTIILLGFGTLVLGQLGYGAYSTRWIEFFRRHMLGLQVAAIMMVVFTLPSNQAWREHLGLWLIDGRPRWLLGRLAAAFIALCVVAIQWLMGTEEGLMGLVQPVELLKALMIVLVSMGIVQLQSISKLEDLKHRWLDLSLVAITLAVFLALLVAVPAFKQDYSPIIILTLTFICMAVCIGVTWKSKVLPRFATGTYDPGMLSMLARRSGAWLPLLSAPILVISVLIAFGYVKSADIPVPSESLQERVETWRHPERFQGTQMQVIKSMSAVGGSDMSFTQALGEPNGQLMTVPAIQNDFIGTFVIGRFGLQAAMLLVLVQIGFLYVLGTGAINVLRVDEGNDEDEAVRRFLAYAAVGATSLAFWHWLIAWCNVLGMLPVMGQPMTWIASATSHLLGMGIPILLVGLLACSFPISSLIAIPHGGDSINR